MEIQKIRVGSIDLHCAEFQTFTDHIFERLNHSPGQIIIVHINLRNFYFMNKDESLLNDIRNKSLAVFEGIGLKFCMAVKGKGFLNDLNGTDLIPLFLDKPEIKKYGIFLLGATQESVEGTIKNIKNNHPFVKICGFHNGYFEDSEELKIIEQINSSQADILLVGMGFPIQEKFIFKYRDKLNVKLIWNLGGLFDFLSGVKPRAPYLIRKMRLEWLYRFMKEPFRMLHRNTVAATWSVTNIIFSTKNSS